MIDEDLGRSASGSDRRSGLERMVAEVCLGKVGAVAAREVSRFAMNSREWQQLVDVCRVVDTRTCAPRNRHDLLGGQLTDDSQIRQRAFLARKKGRDTKCAKTYASDSARCCDRNARSHDRAFRRDLGW